MLSQALHKHLDGIDAINADVLNEVDKILSTLNIKALIANPHNELGRVTEEVNNIIIDKYQPLAHLDGLKLAKVIDARRVVVDPSKDPTKNQEDAAK